ncbi:MAG TPA: M48 family metalloprotease [Tepidisphaeraceae bacterium]|nr:M48 family metalloprotease [Tepidisphaeraceae bacterium]
MHKQIIKTFLAGALLFAAGCNQQQMAAGMKMGSAVTMSEEKEDELGQSVVIAATNRWPILDRPALNKYVTLVGLTVAGATNRPDGNWQFAVIDTPDIGAYSGPGGYVLVTRGAIEAMEDEAELAGVLAHEIAHVANKDGFEAVKRARFNEGALQFAAASDSRLAAFGKETDLLVNTVLTSGWNQDQETKADTSAVKLLQRAGYDAGGLPRFLARMEQRRGGSGRGKAFGTHPGTADRVAKTTAQIGSAKPGATNRERFARAKAEARL